MRDIVVREEIVLPRRVVPQPQPFITKGGDCGACVLGGLLGLTVGEVYDRTRPEDRSFCRPIFESLLMIAKIEGLLDRLILDVPIWFQRKATMSFGLQGHMAFTEWFSYVRMAIEAGYYGICEVSFDQEGPQGKYPPETDHVVLICGVREVQIPLETMKGCSRTDCEILVSCSARSSPDEEWVEVQSFLSNRGGYNIMLARPAGAP